ncbi:hypothetical protein [Peribacillus loiseleuriae]|nr:hypothetical protein [Peribacillus loiseleuriae]
MPVRYFCGEILDNHDYTITSSYITRVTITQKADTNNYVGICFLQFDV